MIEISKRTGNEFWTDDYDHAVLYCMFFEQGGKKGWRLPTDEEWSKYDEISVAAWSELDGNSRFRMSRLVIPVRGSS